MLPMSRATLYRLLGPSLAALAVALTVTTSALAGGGDPPTGPSVSLSPPSFALDGAGGVVVSLTLSCWDEAVDESAVVDIGVSLAQGRAHGGFSVEETCTEAPQALSYVIASDTARGFHPGPVEGMIEYAAATSKGAGIASAPINELLLPTQAGR